jgi:arylsulfatase A-like enzyme
MAVSVDWLPTLSELTGVPLPKRRIDGKSLVPVIRSAKAISPHKDFHWQSGRGLGGKPQWAVRSGSWKLIGNPKDTSSKLPVTKADQLFLVNLEEDPGETKNVAAQEPETTKRLQRLHETWLQDVKEQ